MTYLTTSPGTTVMYDAAPSTSLTVNNAIHIRNAVTSAVVTGSGNGSTALFYYDGTTESQNTPVATSGDTGAPGHDDQNFGTGRLYRGNLGRTRKLISGSLYAVTSRTF
jgi:hypothetical protein